MKDPRASKRRRVSGDADGDIEMGEEQDVLSGPSSPNGRTSPTPVKSASRRRSMRADDAAEPVDENDEQEQQTPARAGTRSSGRVRKTPKRFEDEAVTPSRRKSTTTPSRTPRVPRSAQKPKQSPVEDEKEEPQEEDDEPDFEEEDDEDEDDDEMDVDEPSPNPARRSVSRTKSRRSTAKPATKSKPRPTRKAAERTKEKSPSPEYQDGLDDLVAMQLQQGLPQALLEKQDTVEVNEPLPEYAEKLQSLCQSGLAEEVRILSTAILEKLSGTRQFPIRGLQAEYQKVHQLIEQTVSVGEGNSMLLLGSRGCGKTAIVETIISSLRKEHDNEFHVVRLNGFLHTDDRLALREMWRQLGREMHTEDDAAKVNSYADTMATLLALLSHPEELFGSSGDSGAKTAAKSIVILLDEFDLFVTHPRQTLLYNLFDIAQARKAPIAVIGLTTKVDVTEMLEKRVKSRFSHRYTYVPLPRSFEDFSDICLGSLDLGDTEVVDLANELGVQHDLVESNRWTTLLGGWKEYLNHLWKDQDFQFHLKQVYNQTKSVKDFLASALLPMSDFLQSVIAADASIPQVPTPKAFSSQTLSCPDPPPLPFSTSITSSSPSSLPLALLVAATRLAALFDPSNDGVQSMGPLALSFPAAYAEYVRLLTSAKTSASVSGAAATPGRVWGREVARESWEKLLSWGLVTPVGSGNGTADGQMFRVEISFEEVIEMAGSGGSLGQWWRE
ncbi:hypothetical protein N7452_002076 [Penicillium brevicompactum]|uniref:Origin recognition complex subunit 4 n=1 Tax=Penicillium brevicompactum TaxID=5074 RepID=A0A9W9R3K5_PENBR|nr:hypothetical protein N7452_002076 [Penicillium brevicompactum]